MPNGDLTGLTEVDLMQRDGEEGEETTIFVLIHLCIFFKFPEQTYYFYSHHQNYYDTIF